jgi:hypothetical protein
MRADEYDALIADPTAYLLETWLPRASTAILPPGAPVTAGNQLALIKGGMAMLRYFNAFGPQVARLREESGTVSAIAGIFKAPMDILADKLRGYLGLVEDLHERRPKVVAACEALMPHLAHVARTTADPNRLVPVGYWMHRGGVPFVSPEVFRNVYWATVKPIIEDLWSHSIQTLFYAEGKWDKHLESFAELPERSIVYHVDRGDLALTKRTLGDRFCISGGVPNTLLATGTPDQVRAEVRRILDVAKGEGGYVLDASAIVQNDARPENVRAMTDAAREFGAYSDGHASTEWPAPNGGLPLDPTARHPALAHPARPPGSCLPWSEHRPTLGPIPGDEALFARVWDDLDANANAFVWQILLSF